MFHSLKKRQTDLVLQIFLERHSLRQGCCLQTERINMRIERTNMKPFRGLDPRYWQGVGVGGKGWEWMQELV